MRVFCGLAVGETVLPVHVVVQFLSTLKMEAANFSEMWLSIYQTTWHDILEGCTLCICLFSVFR
jgi:hypothetical protein